VSGWWTSKAVWKSALLFALAGPLVGLAILVAFVCVKLAVNGLLGTDPPPPGALWSFVHDALFNLPFILRDAYVVGGAAAFAAGAILQAMAGRDVPRPWTVAATVLVGAAISTLTIRELDLHVLPHHMGDPAPLLEADMWYFIGCIGAVSALICTLWRLRSV